MASFTVHFITVCEADTADEALNDAEHRLNLLTDTRQGVGRYAMTASELAGIELATWGITDADGNWIGTTDYSPKDGASEEVAA